MNNKIKAFVIIFTAIITSIILIQFSYENFESLPLASEYDGTIFVDNRLADNQTCYGKTDDGSRIPLECDIPLHGNSPMFYQGSQKNSIQVFAHDDYYDIEYKISNGDVDSIKFLPSLYSLEVKITPTGEGELSLDMPTGKDGLFRDYCEKLKSEYPPVIMVIQDGEEIEHELFEIDTDLLNVKFNYLSESKLIEIIYACLV